jgi:hypothetical protein
MLLLLLLAPTFTVPPAPTEAGRLRDVVWPVLIQAAPADGTDGLLWATEPTPQVVRLHRVLFAAEREVTDDVVLPAGASPAATAEAVRLRLGWLLEAPPEAGTHRPAPELAPPPPPPLLPADRAGDLVTIRPALPGGRTTRVPLPPGVPLESPDASRQFEESAVPPEEAGGRLHLRVGGEAVALPGVSLGLTLGLGVVVSPSWQIGGWVSAHPFHEFVRENRYLGATSLRMALEVDHTLWSAERLRLAGVGGLFYGTLSGVGGVTTTEGRPGLALGGRLEAAVGGPLHLVVEAAALAAAGTTEAQFSGEVLRAEGPFEARLACLLGWRL